MSSKRFSKVSPAVWRSRRFISLSTCEAKLLYLYFVTSEHQTSIGAYSIPTGYAIADLGWKVEAYETARAEIEKAGLIVFDEDTETVYVQRWFKHCPPMNVKHSQGCHRLIGELDSEMIAEKVQADLDEVESGRNPIPDAPNVSPALMESLRRTNGGRGW
jgi:hypothetical protein